ncbi:MAG: hypothetical protein ACJAQT_002636 [Akkermansiaceae bacterium]|jgi:hypothetical protein
MNLPSISPIIQNSIGDLEHLVSKPTHMKQLFVILPLVSFLHGQTFVDFDNDGLADAWELIHFPTLATATGSGNSDEDDLTNLAEQTAGTNPTKSDTDDDGLQDHVETGSGIFTSASDTGTTPLDPDSDADGLLDGEEVSATNGAITDPNKEDSDDDNFNDRVELDQGTNPNDPAEKPDGRIPLEISEISASNETGFEDGNGSRSDWIEVYNPNTTTVTLTGFYLTDDVETPTKWKFPTLTIGAKAYRLVFASGDNLTDPAGNPHTNFRLSGAGEYLALVNPDGESIEDLIRPTYPEQFADISYGRPSGDRGRRFFSSPTPGSANLSAGSPGVVKDTNFSIDRGFYDDAFDLQISTSTIGSTIRYTLDGSVPSLSNGLTYTGPITIATTTNLRAISYFQSRDFIPTNVDTHTYLFLDDVETQNKTDLIAKGWAENWGYDSELRRVVPADYDMDQRVVNDTLNLREPGYSMRDALLDIPSVSLTLLQEDFVTTRNGTSSSPRSLYGTPRERFEKNCSVEYILPDGTSGFQEDCIVETHGNSSRRPARMQKHSLRLTFSSDVGIGKLRYNLFPESPVDEFNKLVLRACFTDSWALSSWSNNRYRPNDSLYTRDVWMKDLFRNMGQPSSYGNFVHLYVNGAYFGLHNLSERLEDDFYADHLGGEKEDWEVNADLLSPSNTIPLWNSMLSTLNGNIETTSVYETAKTKIDVVNYADWVLLHLFADAEDWPVKNAYAAVNAVSGDGRYRFSVWDQEISFDKYSWNRYNATGTGMRPFQRLRRNEDFQMLFADRAYKHLHDDGALTVAQAADTFLGIQGQIDKAIIAESARWGDVQASTPYGDTASTSRNIDNDSYPPTINSPIYFTREQHWLVEQENVVTNYLPTLHDPNDSRSFIRELRSRNLYPAIDPPFYSQLGGEVPINFPLQLTSPDGAVYYTIDGSDPRLSGGSVNPTAGSFGGFIEDSLIENEDFGWTYLAGTSAQSASNITFGQTGYGPSDWKHPFFDDNSWAPNLVNNPNGAQAPFAGNSATQVSGFIANTVIDIGSFSNSYPTVYFRKDFTVTGAVDYVELSFSAIRDDAMIIYLNGRELFRDNFDGPIVSYADFGSGGSETVPAEFTHTLAAGELMDGLNTLAIEVHNSSKGSSDLGIQINLSGSKTAPGGNIVKLTETGVVNARSLVNGEWSALRTADFIVGTPATAGNLVVSEIMYHPQGPDENLEFIEILNINPNLTLDLTNVSCTDGILYTFPAGFILPPLQRVVIAKDRAAFIALYGENDFILAPNQFESTLSNGGETLTLAANDGTTIQSFTYDDDANLGWPPSADGLGSSLVLSHPLANPNHSLATSWMASSIAGGTPGLPDMSSPINPDGDADSDNLNNLAEYFFGTDPTSPNRNPVTLVNNANTLSLSFARNAFTVGVTWEIESSRDLETWTSAPTTRNPATVINNGQIQESLAVPPSETRKFYRVRILPN